ncbi:MAG: putative hydrogenase nickel incorporation protein HypA [Phycisphaerae bacterium]|nr:MAG: putative hydrogenase nickel incorporation protein HypA [Phycisphaerae bacterium]
MHEFSVARSICNIALEESRRHDVERVTAICIEVGAMRQIVPELLRTAFDIAAKETILYGAKLEIHDVPITIKCCDCGQFAASATLQLQCVHCGSANVEINGGNEMMVSSIRVAEEACHEH